MALMKSFQLVAEALTFNMVLVTGYIISLNLTPVSLQMSSVSLDVEECQDEIHNCDVNALCKNTDGSFKCTCLQGYSGDGVNCFGKVRE